MQIYKYAIEIIRYSFKKNYVQTLLEEDRNKASVLNHF